MTNLSQLWFLSLLSLNCLQSVFHLFFRCRWNTGAQGVLVSMAYCSSCCCSVFFAIFCSQIFFRGQESIEVGLWSVSVSPSADDFNYRICLLLGLYQISSKPNANFIFIFLLMCFFRFQLGFFFVFCVCFVTAYSLMKLFKSCF